MLSYSHTFSLFLSAAIIKHIKQYLNAGVLFRFRLLYNNRMWMWRVTVTLHLVRSYTLTTYLGLHIRSVILRLLKSRVNCSKLTLVTKEKSWLDTIKCIHNLWLDVFFSHKTTAKKLKINRSCDCFAHTT